MIYFGHVFLNRVKHINMQITYVISSLFKFRNLSFPWRQPYITAICALITSGTLLETMETLQLACFQRLIPVYRILVNGQTGRGHPTPQGLILHVLILLLTINLPLKSVYTERQRHVCDVASDITLNKNAFQ